MSDTEAPNPNPYNVAKGQVWAATSDRETGIPFTILAVEELKALVGDGAKKRRIRLDRFKPTKSGYHRLR